MKHFKKPSFLLAIICVFIFAGSAVAERAQKNIDWAEHKVERMQQKLKLSDEQANTIYSILGNAKSEGNNCGSFEKFTEKRDCRQAKRKAKHQKILTVLNDDQKTAFKEFHQERKARRSKCRHNGGECPHGAKSCGL